ncbi:hypothetical protein [Dialister succinatiphilus]|jgi:hypothetical protein|uniref:hypothetical protein n=1 Tax=Dialister succinatiphilus TaxID=487173 RepID=UPI003AF14FB3
MESKELYRLVKIILLDNNLSERGAAALLKTVNTNFSRKLKAGTLRATELINLLNMLGYKVYAERTNDAGEAERTELK